MTEHKFPRSNKVDICLAFVEKAEKSRSYKNLKMKFLQDLQFAYDTSQQLYNVYETTFSNHK